MDLAHAEAAIASLRRATRDRHAALEDRLQLLPLLYQRRYVDALRGFERFLSAWEPRVDAALPRLLRHWFAARSRQRFLRQDLAQLDGGYAADEQATRACNRAVADIDLAGTAGTFGSLYVLEGSALGGQLIARAAAATLGLTANHGAAYFNGFDRHTAERWTAFKGLLEEQVGTQPLARRQACDSACQTFDALIVTFTRPGREHAAA